MSMRSFSGICRSVACVVFFKPACLVLTGVLVLGACSGSISREAYAGMAAQLQDAGLLRTERAPADAPYSAKDLARNFQRIAFSYEFQFRGGKVVNEPLSKPLNRWSGSIRYRIIGDATMPEDVAEIDRLTREIGHLTGLQFQRSDDAHDMLISIASPKGQEDVSDYLGRRNMGTYRHRYELWRASRTWVCGATMSGAKDGSGRLVYAHIFMGSDVKGILRTSCLHEEIIQALGLTNDHPDARPSIFNDDQEFAVMTDHDATLLRILYDPALRPGMSVTEAMPIVRRIVPRHAAAVAHDGRKLAARWGVQEL